MPRSSLRRLFGAVLLALALVGPVEARSGAAVPPGTFRTSLVLANPNAQAATAVVRFNSPTGRLAHEATLTLPAGASRILYVPNIAELPDGRYSADVVSDRYVSLLTNLTSDDARTATAYTGARTGDGRATTLLLPLVFGTTNFGYQGTLVVQNAGNEAATSVELAFLDFSGGVVRTTQATIAPLGQQSFDLATLGLGEGLRSLVVTASNPVAATFFSANPEKGRLGSVRAMSVGAPGVYLPVVYDEYFGYATAVYAQNASSGSSTFQLDYYSPTGAPVGSEAAAASKPGATAELVQYDTDGTTSIVRPGFNGSAVLLSREARATVAIGAIFSTGAPYELYNGVPATLASARAACTSILKRYFGYSTSLTVQNVGSAATDLTLTYADAAGRPALRQEHRGLQPGAILFRYTPNEPGLPDGFSGQVTVEASGGQKVIAVVNELLEAPGDQLFTYNCDNSAGGEGVSFAYAPLVLKNAPFS